MVEFARATVEEPRLLLLDEPASGLDEFEAERLGQLIHAVRHETGCSVVVVEHNAGFIMEHCDRVVVLAVGAVLAEGTPDEVRQDSNVRSAYLGWDPALEAVEGSTLSRRSTTKAIRSPQLAARSIDGADPYAAPRGAGDPPLPIES
jgi:branched-chain amino acid transport system ATP-binding protein